LHVTYTEKQISPVNQAVFCGFAEFASTFSFYAPYFNFPPSHGCRKAGKKMPAANSAKQPKTCVIKPDDLPVTSGIC
jgi:hypothetical protein